MLMAPKTEPMIHRCLFNSGSMEGSYRVQNVSPSDIEYKYTCENCGERLAPINEVLAFIYQALTE